MPPKQDKSAASNAGVVAFNRASYALEQMKTRLDAVWLKDFDAWITSTTTEIKFRHTKFLDLSKEFSMVRQNMFSCLSNLEDRDELLKQFEGIISDCEEILDKCQLKIIVAQEEVERISVIVSPSPASSVRTASNDPSKFHFKLDRIKLPSFSGKFSEWEEFRDLFISAVDKNPTLTGTEKIIYLKTSLTGEALGVVKNFKSTETAYTDAWKEVVRRYANPREIVFSHIRSFDDVPRAQDTAPDIRRVTDCLNELSRSLSSHQVPVEHWDVILVFLALKKLDTETRKEWLLTQETKLPVLSELIEFLENRARALTDAYQSKKVTKKTNEVQDPKCSKPFVQRSSFATKSESGASRSAPNCIYCDDPHLLYQCDAYKKLSIDDRKIVIDKKERCINCFGKGHTNPADCKSKFSCRKCKGRHNTLLCKSTTDAELKVPAQPSGSQAKPQSVEPSSAQSFHVTSNDEILLETAMVSVPNVYGELVSVRVFVDKGSQMDLITERCLAILGFRRHGDTETTQIMGLGGVQVGLTKGKVHLTLHSRLNNFCLPVEVDIVEKVTSGSFPCRRIRSKYHHLRGLTLADPTFYDPQPIDMMLGARYASLIKTGGFVIGPPGTPSAEETHFGWLLSGTTKPVANSIGRIPNSGTGESMTFYLSTEFNRLEKSLEKFWESEEPEVLKCPRSKEDEICESIFKITTSRNDVGRYIVSLPFRENHPSLQNSLAVATRRFYSVEHRMQRNPMIKSEYARYFREHLAAGIMEVVPDSEISKDTTQLYYMPYHEVVKESSSTTKVRVVYDCSAKTIRGPSLNEILMPGPKLQADLVSLLINFRAYPIAISADISKFFNQVEVTRQHQDFQRLIFRENPDLPVTHYRMKRLTFGLTPAPYLASRALHQLFDDECSDLAVTRIVKSETLVDNVITGAFTLQRALVIQQELLKTMSKGSFELRKWASNVPAMLESVPKEHREIDLPLRITDDHELPTLGVKWNPSLDKFQLCIPKFDINPIANKRSVLSAIARIFDPLGWLAPVTIRPKLFLQELWKEKVDWDSPLPTPHQHKWHRTVQDLLALEQFQLKRCYYPIHNWDFENGKALSYQLYGFSDASNLAFSAVVYLRCLDPDGSASVSLVGAKTKVAPVKGETTPRLELNGARLLSRFLKTVIDSIPFQIESISCFSDSTSVLGQLNPNSKDRKDVFVTNRVRTIQQNLPTASWYHVPGEENPADCASRGISASEFLTHPLWRFGPRWLQHGDFPKASFLTTTQKKEVAESVSVIYQLVMDTSCYSKLIRIVAYVLRFVRNLTSESRITGPLTTTELRSALESVARAVQTVAFGEELKMMRRVTPLVPERFKFLSPLLDEAGIIRVGGRLRHANLPQPKTHPILLPRKHHFSSIVARYYHVVNLHPGPNLLLSLIRETFWIIDGSHLATQIFRKCVICHRANPTPLTQIMSDLPPARVTLSRPFTNTAMDFAGPFTIAMTTGRNPRLFKCYFCVYVCMAVKAVHIEVVTDLSTPAFIASLQRFVSRRGRPADLYSDGGKNFVGARNELKDVVAFLSSDKTRDHVNQFCSELGIEFHFNTPSAPHHGGLFEAAVKSIKHHLHKILEDRHPSLEEFLTLLCQIEGVLNSRPLTPLSSDPNEFSALTPAHFLIGGPLVSVPQKDISDVKESSLTRWQKTERLFQIFWKRFHREYLTLLQTRPKWLKAKTNVTVGALVLMKESDAAFSSHRWNLARITRVFPGRDGLVRSVEVKTPNGSHYKRPIVKIAPLPIVE